MGWARAALGGVAGLALGAALFALAPQKSPPTDPEAPDGRAEAAAQAVGVSEAATAPAPPADTASGGDAPVAGAQAQLAHAQSPAATEPLAAPQASAAAATQAAAEAAPADDAEAAGDGVVPRFDVVRVEPDGAAVFAGVAEPGADIRVSVDGAVVATARAGEDGGFVAFGQAPRGDALQRLDLSAAQPGAAATAAAPAFPAPAPASEDPDAEPVLARPAIIQPTAEGVAVLQAPARPDDEAVTLDVVTYGADGAVELGGRGEALRPLRVFANALMIAETSVAADGRWTARSRHELAPGAYTLRVEALGRDGRVEFVVESPFRREDAGRARPPSPGEVVVQPGDTLWALAQNLYGAGPRYTVIYGANAGAIRDPDLIYPGQVLAIPEATP